MQVELEALKNRLFGDSQIKNVKFFPGQSSDATPEDMAREMNKFFADPHNNGDDNELSHD